MLKLPVTLLVVLLFTCLYDVLAQEPDTTKYTGAEEIEQQIENLAERSDVEMDYSDWVEEMNLLRQRPVNLNSGDENELRRLFFLNDLQISNLLEYTQQYGQLASIYELQVIEGFNEKVVSQIMPFISLSPYVPEKFSLKRALKYGGTDVMLRYQRVIQPQSGYANVSDSVRLAHPNNYYVGDQNSLFFRVQYSYKDYLKFGMVGDKDAGESFMPKSDTLHKGFDFYSVHLFIKNIGIVKQLAIGDYHVQFGQGLTLWSGFSVGKATGSVVMRKRAPALRAHSSSNEYAFMRGAATTVAIGKFDITVFYSNRKVDANVVPADTLETSEDLVTSLQQTGYHRTPAEIADKGANREIAEGGHISYNGQRLRAGITAFHVDYKIPFEPESALYKKFQPTLSSNTYTGIDYSYNYKTLTLYGEVSKQINAGLAVLQGLSFSPDPRLALAMVYRNYQKNYLNTFNAAFGESSNSTNEKGLYVGMVATPFNKITLSAYADMFKHEWLSYRVDAPSEGQEYSAQIVYNVSRRGDIVLSYRNMINPMNYALANDKMNQVGESKRSYYRVQFNYQAMPWLKLQSRIEITKRQAQLKSKETGYLIYQGLQVNPLNKNWSLSFRYSMFDTDSYDTRLYAFEQDVPYSFSVPAFSGEGSRFYMLLNSSLTRNVSLILRFSQTWYSDRNVISSGPDEIAGNKKSDFKAVVRLSF
ncbi:MAG: helix-hairpin-helix domain-containing protein [Bacteroidales bacterium]|nr:helix-hairpin-helix domain-containing protein [Bacteroidales bacterium]